MTDTTYQAPNLTLEAQNVLTALQDLALATRRLVVAAFFKLAQYRQPDPQLTAQQQAAELRAYADRFYAHDPRYAQDLYASANRHEKAAE